MELLIRNLAFAFLAILVFSSCEKEEDLLPGEYRSDVPGQVNMVSEGGVDYQMQIYFDLSSGENKGENKRDVWDLALGCDASNPNLFINPSMLQRVAATGSTDFSASYDPANFAFDYERAKTFYRKGRMMKDWNGTTSDEQVYIVDMGKTMTNQSRGYKLFQAVSFNGQAYTVKISNLDHSDLQELLIPVNSDYTHVYISFSNPSDILELEPPKEEWDILFTKYMERLFDGVDTLDYSVTGALLNPYKSVGYFHEESYLDSTWNYSDLSYEDIEESRYSTRSDVVGHDWKYYDLDAGAYSAIPSKHYFIKDAEEQNYRLHFTGFYDEQGRKGGVSFEYLPL
ncbi:hypothetical protein Oweho_0321 [Owenweeksia hongkongensis DSM 17368]|uniref:HmuY protein n=1 Tax=Owenweeksia hongkongensis (strain DSM 17368 / CIP 108786 / JCM 12287 / NRRL B-23963 / UST20020801) TaxID=926562 RepID=G8R819_OWEHD|nr:HmuY family protein [Owenweeksia hongkongensis]AEV31342.1 hypothetical protein Oweho_0321 [Owenweeksia hongkongensis DSM 17368]